MPTPVEILMDPISLVILAMYVLLVAWEAVFPARVLPEIPWWKTRALCIFVVYFYLTTYLPLYIDPLLTYFQVFDLSGLGTIGGAFVAIVLLQAGIYFWHRAMHRNATLWRVLHQMHHSAERVDTFGAFYFSPLDMVGFSIVGSLCAAPIFGLAPQSTTICRRD